MVQFKQQLALQDRLEAKCNTQDQEIRQMRKVLTQTIEIKMQYETVLQELMKDESILAKVLSIIDLK